ncbi:MAG: hypothetical protein Q9219_005151 [cf. Caloplaca sp. 3 TL-2023]
MTSTEVDQESLHRSRATTPAQEASLMDRKSILGKSFLSDLLQAFLDETRDVRARRWAGSLALELLSGCRPNLDFLSSQKSADLRQALGKSIIHTNSEILRLIAGTIIRGMVECSLTARDFWSSDTFPRIPAAFEDILERTSQWTSDFVGVIDELETQGSLTQGRNLSLFAYAISVNEEIYNTTTGLSILITLAGDLSIMIPSSDSNPIRYIDVPLDNIGTIQLENGVLGSLSTKDSPLIGYVLVVNLGETNHVSCFVNEIGHRSPQIILAFDNLGEVKSLKEQIEAASARQKICHIKRSTALADMKPTAPIMGQEIELHSQSTNVDWSPHATQNRKTICENECETRNLPLGDEVAPAPNIPARSATSRASLNTKPEYAQGEDLSHGRNVSEESFDRGPISSASWRGGLQIIENAKELEPNQSLAPLKLDADERQADNGLDRTHDAGKLPSATSQNSGVQSPLLKDTDPVTNYKKSQRQHIASTGTSKGSLPKLSRTMRVGADAQSSTISSTYTKKGQTPGPGQDVATRKALSLVSQSTTAKRKTIPRGTLTSSKVRKLDDLSTNKEKTLPGRRGPAEQDQFDIPTTPPSPNQANLKRHLAVYAKSKAASKSDTKIHQSTKIKIEDKTNKAKSIPAVSSLRKPRAAKMKAMQQILDHAEKSEKSDRSSRLRVSDRFNIIAGEAEDNARNDPVQLSGDDEKVTLLGEASRPSSNVQGPSVNNPDGRGAKGKTNPDLSSTYGGHNARAATPPKAKRQLPSLVQSKTPSGKITGSGDESLKQQGARLDVNPSMPARPFSENAERTRRDQSDSRESGKITFDRPNPDSRTLDGSLAPVPIETSCEDMITSPENLVKPLDNADHVTENGYMSGDHDIRDVDGIGTSTRLSRVNKTTAEDITALAVSNGDETNTEFPVVQQIEESGSTTKLVQSLSPVRRPPARLHSHQNPVRNEDECNPSHSAMTASLEARKTPLPTLHRSDDPSHATLNQSTRDNEGAREIFKNNNHHESSFPDLDSGSIDMSNDPLRKLPYEPHRNLSVSFPQVSARKRWAHMQADQHHRKKRKLSPQVVQGVGLDAPQDTLGKDPNRIPQIITFSAKGPRNQGWISNILRTKTPATTHDPLMDRDVLIGYSPRTPALRAAGAVHIHSSENKIAADEQPYGQYGAPSLEYSSVLTRDRASKVHSQSSRVTKSGSPLPAQRTPRTDPTAEDAKPAHTVLSHPARSGTPFDGDGTTFVSELTDESLEVQLPHESPHVDGQDKLTGFAKSSNSKHRPSSPTAPSALLSDIQVHTVQLGGQLVNLDTDTTLVPSNPQDPFVDEKNQCSTGFLDRLRQASDRDLTKNNFPLSKAPGQPRAKDIVTTTVNPDDTHAEGLARTNSTTLSGGNSQSSHDSEGSGSAYEAWRNALEPHQDNMLSVLSEVSHGLFGHLMEQETAIADVIKDYCQQGQRVIKCLADDLERSYEQYKSTADVRRSQVVNKSESIQAQVTKNIQRKSKTAGLALQVEEKSKLIDQHMTAALRLCGEEME